MITAARAIETIETLGGYKLVKRYRYWNGDTNRHETCYVFKSVGGARHDWAHETTIDCLRQLRFYAWELARTRGVKLA